MAKRCFVIMPFGEKKDVDGKVFDFDVIYERLIKPSIEAVDIECIRCDEVLESGWIHEHMIKHIFKADVAVVDISTLNANVFYELGVRHALRPSVTVLIRMKGTKTPFNIQGFNVIEYAPDDLDATETKSKVGQFIRAGLLGGNADSLVHKILPLQIRTEPRMLTKTEEFTYRFANGRDAAICILTGDIQRIKTVDIWVNSENTNMEMARFSDKSVSSHIRYLGAEKNKAGGVTNDTIAAALSQEMGQQKTVPAACIISTTSGQLARTHGVKRIFHAAAVENAAVGRGYAPVANIADCVPNALTMADDPELDSLDVRSILFPLFGTGTGSGDLKTIVASLIGAAIEYLRVTPNSRIQRVCFLAFNEEHFSVCQDVLEKSQELVAP